MTSNQKNLLALAAVLVTLPLLLIGARWIVFDNRFGLSAFARAMIAAAIVLIWIGQALTIARIKTTN